MRTLLLMVLPFFYVYDQLLVCCQSIYIHFRSYRLFKAILALSRLLCLLLLHAAVLRFVFPFSLAGVRVPFVFLPQSGVDLYSTSRDKRPIVFSIVMTTRYSYPI